MPTRLFITGTDTGVGTTLVATTLLALAADSGMTTLACKPVAAGCDWIDGQLQNADALALQSAVTHCLSYGQVNPIALELPIAPHIAAQMAGLPLKAGQLAAHIEALGSADLLLVEGAGGWLVPLNHHETMADVATKLDLSVILVVGLKLGCINHALLSAAAIRVGGLKLLAWVGNCIDPAMAMQDQNLATLTEHLAAPCLGVIPYLESCNSQAAKPFLQLW